MIEQQGQVVALSGSRVSVRLGGKSGCSACDAGKGCGAGVFGRLLQRKPVVMDFENGIDAACGQGVIIGLPESLFLRLLLRFYLYPLLAGLVGAIAGYVLATRLEAGPLGADALTLAGAILSGGFMFWSVRSTDRKFQDLETVHLLRVAGHTLNQESNQEVNL